MTDRYAMEVDGPSTWTVSDRFTGQPARYAGVELISMPLDDADDLTDLLNHMDEQRRAKGLPESDKLR